MSTARGAVKILIVDDHAIVRLGLRQILAGSPDLDVAGEATSGQEALAQVASGQWDVVILDLSLEDGQGLDVLKGIKDRRPGLPVLVLSMHAEEQYAMRVLRAGAAGYLNKRSAPEQLITAIRKVVKGERYFSPTLAEELATRMITNHGPPLHEGLSDREYQILCLIAAGMSVGEIARDLRLSAKTVSTHRAHILEKMGMKRTGELMRYAIQNRLVD